MREIPLRFDEPLLRGAVRAFVARTLWRQLGPSTFVALAVVVASLAYLLARGERGWFVGVMATVLLVAVLLPWFTYVAHRNHTVGKFRRMGGAGGTFGYDEENLMLASPLGRSTMPWSGVAEIWRYPRFWLLVLGPGQFVTLPADCLDAETRAFLERKMEGRLA
jgi:hypothetical protein